MNMYATPQAVEKYLNTYLDCSCGRTHYVPIKAVAIGPGALNRLPALVKDLGYSKPMILCDKITRTIAGERCAGLLAEAGITAKLHTLTHMGYDEATLGEIVINMPADCDLIIAVGTGAITDMTRYATYKLRLPCFTVATGAPMDGFAASIGVLNVNGLKCTLPAHNTEVIIGDTDILAGAPYRMTVAGFGDLIGKITCLNDWALARIVNEEHYCAPIVELVQTCVNDILGQAEGLKNKDPEVLGRIMEGLVLSGAAISLYGDSRPASGAEHHMSHYWETLGDQSGKSYAMHGEQVAVATVLVLMLAELLKEITPDFEAARAFAGSYNPLAWEQEIYRAYGPAAEEVLVIEQKARKNDPAEVLKRIDSMEAHWPEIVAQLNTLPSAASLRETLKYVGSPAAPADCGISEAMLKDTFLYCKEVRPRYTIFQMVYDLGLMDRLSDEIIELLR